MPPVANPDVAAVRAIPEALALDQRDTVISLRDGRTVSVRPVRPNDEPALRAFLETLSPSTRRLRFFSGAANLRAAAPWSASADGEDHFGLLALDATQRIVGHAAYVRMYGPRAEVAVEVADHLHHRGLGTRMVMWLAQVAERHGIRRFIAEVLAENSEMLAVFRDGFAPAQSRAAEIITIEFPTSNWHLAHRRFCNLQPS